VLKSNTYQVGPKSLSLEAGDTRIDSWRYAAVFGRQIADQPQQVRGVILLAAGGMVEPEDPVQRTLNTIFNPASSGPFQGMIFYSDSARVHRGRLTTTFSTQSALIDAI
jgi:hypothetical protein